MKVWCAACGEELMGSVNRCWKCGKTFPVQPEGGSKPPIRRLPIAAARPQPVSESSGETGEGQFEFVATVAKGDNPTNERERPASLRRGSPFARGSNPRPIDEILTIADQNRNMEVNSPAAKPGYDLRKGMYGMVLAAVVLGTISLLVVWILPYAGVLLSIIGLMLSVVALHSGRQKGVLTALILCCFSLLVSTGLSAFDFYQRMGF